MTPGENEPRTVLDAIDDAIDRMRAIPTERVRALAEIIKRAWEPFTDNERIDLLGMINHGRAPIDRATIEKMLAATGNNITLTARNLGIAHRTLQNKMRAFGMPPGKHGRKIGSPAKLSK